MSEVETRLHDAVGRRATNRPTGNGAFSIALALVGVGGAGILALVASRASEPLVLTIMAALATIGVFFLFALAAQHIRFGNAVPDAAFPWGIVEALDDAVVVVDPAGHQVASNGAFRELVGTNALGETNSLESMLAAETVGTEALFRLARAVERGESGEEEIHLPSTASGPERWLRLKAKPFVPPGGKSRVVALQLWRIVDITSERQAQGGVLHAIESRLAQYDNAPIGVMTVDADGHVCSMNEWLSRWLAYPVDATSGEPRTRDLQLSEMIADGGAQLVTALAGQGVAERRVDLDLVTEDGRRWPASLHVGAGDKGVFSIAVMERTVETATGKGTRFGGQRFSRLFQSAPLGMAVIGGDGIIVNANAAFTRLLADAKATRGSSVVAAIARENAEAEHQIQAALEAARDGQANIRTFDITLGPKGKELTRKVYVASLGHSANAQDVAIVYLLDVTEAKSLEQKVAQAQKMEAVGTMAGGIAHDFNNVLTAIIGFSDLLLQTHVPGNPAYSHILSIKSSANRAAGLVRQLLAFSRRQTLQPTVLQMGDVLTDLSMMINRYLGEKIELKIVSGRDLWLAKVDRSEIERSIINLAVNARDAMQEKGGRLTISTRNVGERESQKLQAQGVLRGEYVLIEVEDTGSGMTAEVMAKIFDPFFTTKAVGKGTGLGLASVYGIVQQTGGYIIPESTPGVGTTFRMYLPRHQVETDEEAEPVVAEEKKPRKRDLTGSGRVLLVEDEDAVRRFAVAALRSKGYEVLQASDGVEAIEVMKEAGDQVDIVVSDVIMPEMDGPTLMKELRKDDPTLKFIFVSGYPDDAFKHSLDPEADFSFMPKPYRLAEIAAKVKEQISK